MHERGDGAAKDVTLASRLYQRGCDKGSLLSCSNLGAIYSNGTGVSKDEKLAAKLYQRACDGGIPPGCKRRWASPANRPPPRPRTLPPTAPRPHRPAPHPPS